MGLLCSHWLRLGLWPALGALGGVLLGEFGQEASACRCRGHRARHGHCGFHFSFWWAVDEPWCRTKYGCGHSSLLGSWVHCDKLGVERRRARDGNLYTAKDFREYYGSEGRKLWLEAKQQTEKRTARDGTTYSMFEFRDFYVDMLGEEGYLREWAASAPERRRAQDGVGYTWEEFNEYYGVEQAWVEWELGGSMAPPQAQSGSATSWTPTVAPAPPATTPMAVTRLLLFDPAAYPSARCLDGSMAGYYLRGGSEKKYLIYLEGGGWCYDSNCRSPTREGTLRDCRSRAHGRHGSSRQWQRRKEERYLNGMLSGDPGMNPVFHNWTLVYVPYCDGTSFSGDQVVNGLHFRGKAILEAVIADLRSTTDIRKARQVALAGGSAGASAVYWHGDRLAEGLGLEEGEVVGLPDAGFFLNLQHKDGYDCWPSQMRSLFDASNGYSSLHAGCIDRYPQDPWKCLFPEYFADLIKIRMFVINSLYDSSEVTATLGLDCCFAECSAGRSPCSWTESQIFETLREAHAKAWQPLTEKPGNGVWAPSCVGHTLGHKWTDPTWEVPEGSGNTLATVVERWLALDGGGSRHGSSVFVDPVAWPGNGRCVDEW